MENSLNALLRPSSLAIIGASSDPSKPAGRVLGELARFGYSGEIYLVNPNRADVDGRPCHPSVSAIGKSVDLAILALPRDHVVGAIEDCVAAGVPAVLIYAAGFSELDEKGTELQEQISSIALESGIRVFGPNCQGYLNRFASISTSWAEVFPDIAEMGDGSTAWISQSGAVGALAYSLLRKAGVDVGFWASLGNEVDVSVSELIEYAVQQPEIELVCVHVESIKDVGRFRQAAALAKKRNKPIIVLKGGRTPAGSEATRSHTGALASDERGYAALFDQVGVVAVRSVEELVTVALLARTAALEPDAFARGRVAVLTGSGGMGAMIVDACSDAGLSTPGLKPHEASFIQPLIPSFVRAANPIDVSTSAVSDPEVFGRLILETQRLASHDLYVVCLVTLRSRDVVSRILHGIRSAVDQTSAPVAIVMMGCHDDGPSIARELGLAVCEESQTPVVGLAALVRWARRAASRVAGPEETALPNLDVGGSPRPQSLTEYETKHWLAERGVELAEGFVVQDENEAVRVAERLGYPVVAKVSSPSALHKSDIGGVRLKIAQEADLREAFRDLNELVRTLGNQTERSGVLIERQASPGVEVVVGFSKDPALGWLLMVGLGGVFVEVLGDVSVRVLPVSRADVVSALVELKGAALLRGARGASLADVDALVDLVLQLSTIVGGSEGIDEIELNPIFVHAVGAGVTVVDALALLSPESEEQKGADPAFAVVG